jgi:hypothetical protein
MEMVPPKGTTAKARKAGTIDRYGASRKMRRSARSGRRSSLKNSLMPSARVCSRPQGPARSGPIRLCMSEMILRSNHTMNSTETSRKANTTSVLPATIRKTVRSMPSA